MTASKLVRPDVQFKDSYLQALAEYHAEGRYLFNHIPTLDADFPAFIDALRKERGNPHQPFQDWVQPVPETILWMVKDQDYMGSVYIRHRLNWHLEKWGGHLHFIIRPSLRGKGFGRKMLVKSVPFANYLGIEKALLTVAPDNYPAIRIVESVGAAFQDQTQPTEQFPARRRYWLDCT